uniref:Uncharacterized protein n=1 Tax=Arundo donax TaxID=35708 RepID=A0A0A8ZE34_ARUDO
MVSSSRIGSSTRS